MWHENGLESAITKAGGGFPDRHARSQAMRCALHETQLVVEMPAKPKPSLEGHLFVFRRCARGSAAH